MQVWPDLGSLTTPLKVYTDAPESLQLPAKVSPLFLEDYCCLWKSAIDPGHLLLPLEVYQ